MARHVVLKEYTLLVPLFDNEGRAFSAALLDELRAELLTAFGGVTRQDGITGYWIGGDGTIYEDVNCSFTIATALQDGQARVLAVARRWRVRLKQEALYVRLPGGKAIIVVYHRLLGCEAIAVPCYT